MTVIRVLLADDHALVRAGIRALLEGMSGIEIAAEAGDGAEALRLVGEHKPDVALVNISMPRLNGLETLARVCAEHPRTRVIVVSAHSDPEYVHRAVRQGALGYLVKTAQASDLERAVRAAAQGRTWLSPEVSSALVDLVRSQTPPSPLDRLTTRQREVLQLVVEGASTKEIAARLGLSPKTIANHREQLMERLGVRGIPALVRCAIRLGILPPDP
jgi:DNA-binding NarL/FixJ family response regulator